MHNPTIPAQWFLTTLAFLTACTSLVASADDRHLAADTAVVAGQSLARHLEDRDHITLVEFSGNYDRYLDSGELNQAPREGVATEFFATHEDGYDFLVVFSAFAFDMGDAAAFHLGVQNQVEGIGLPVFDHTGAFGSAGKLQGYIDMGPLEEHQTDPLQPGFETTLALLSHEILHQWAAHIRFRDKHGSASDALLDHEDAHWSFLLDSDASVLYGNDWRDNGDGTFTSTAVQRFFSPLDLYLAGFLEPEAVPPFLLIDSPGADKGRLPESGTIVSGTGLWLGIDDVIAVEGPRVPSAVDAQRDFRAAFMLLVRPGQAVSDEQIARLNHVREGFMTRFTALTGGRAVIQVYPRGDTGLTPGSPTPVTGGETRPGDPSISAALAWLRSQQAPAGFWEDVPDTRLRDTAMALPTLKNRDPLFEGAEKALDWLDNQTNINTDFLARKISTLRSMGKGVGKLVDELIARQNLDGGWGAARGLKSDPLDTALAILALEAGAGTREAVIHAGLAYLRGSQIAEGAWGSVAGGPGRTIVTATVLKALASRNESQGAVSAALAWLATRQNGDGGFGDDGSTAHETAIVLSALLHLDGLKAINAGKASAYLRTRQALSGSWEGSVYTTTLVIKVLDELVFPNWAFAGPLAISPEIPRDGERVEISIPVINDSHAPTPPGALRVYAGDPGGDGVPIGSDQLLPALAPGQSVRLTTLWDTLGKAGIHTLVVLIDPENTQAELSELDNRTELAVTVAAASTHADLAIRSSDITVFPPQPQVLPVDLGISVTLRNLGLTAVSAAELRLWLGSATDGSLLEEATVAVPARASAVANFTHTLTRPGVTDFTVEVDPDDLVAEADEFNNRASASVATLDSVDLEVRAGDLTLIGGIARTGGDAEFRVVLHNRGTADAPDTQVRYRVTNGHEIRELGHHTIQPGGGEALEHTVIWRVDMEGDLLFDVQIDPEGLIPESDETNNAATLAFKASRVTEPNLVVDHGDIRFDPEPAMEGKSLALWALVRNTGGSPVHGVSVAFYDGDPKQAGQQLGEVMQIAHLGSGESTTVTTVVPEVSGYGNRLVFVVVDPNDEVTEFSEDDNTAFTELVVLSRADLALGSGSLVLTPRFPRPGESVTLRVAVANLGGQPAEAVTVRAYRGDPEAGGELVDADRIVDRIEGWGVGEVSFTWVQSSSEQVRRVVVQVDPDETLAEGSESNNAAEIKVLAQDADFFVSNRYFSPNGDGVKDTTRFFFRLQQTESVFVRILDQHDEIIRRSQGPLFEDVVDGEFAWNGRDEHGRIARDGDYRLQVLSEAGVLLGEATVTLDTNRSSLIEALGTPYEDSLNLTCELPQVDNLRIAPHGEIYFFSVPRHQPDFEPGVYRMGSSGDDVRRIVAADAIADDADIHQLVVSGDGSQVAFTVSGELWVASEEGIGLRQIDQGSNIWEIYGFASNGQVIARQNYSHVVAIPVETPGMFPRVLYQSQPRPHSGIREVVFSPDRRHLVLLDSPYSSRGPYRVVLLDLEAATGQELLYSDPPPSEGVGYARSIAPPRYAWSPDGVWLAVLEPETGSLKLYDSAGRLQSTHDLPKDEPPFDLVGHHGVRVEPEIWKMDSLVWATSGDELVFKASYQDFFWGPDNPYEHNLFSYHTLLTFDNLIKRFQTLGWSEPVNSWSRSFHIATRDGDAWLERGSLHYGPDFHEQYLDLSGFLPDPDGEIKVRIRQRGGDEAAVDAVSLFVGGARIAPAGAFPLSTGAEVLGPLRYQDDRHLNLHEQTLEVHWENLPPGPIRLALDARENSLGGEQNRLFSALPWLERDQEAASATFPKAKHLFWVPDERALFFISDAENGFSVALLLDEDNRQIPVLEEFQRISPDSFTPSGREFLLRSSDARNNPASPCYQHGYNDIFTLRSLANLTGDLRVRRSASEGGVLLEGTAADRNFSHYLLEFAPLSDPDHWRPIVPASTRQLIDDRFLVWMPPEPGIYWVRLTAEDLAGNRRSALQRITWTEDGAPITDVYREPGIISPNGDGVQDEVVVHYRVLEAANLEFRVLTEAGDAVRHIRRSHGLAGGPFEVSWDGRDDNGKLLSDGDYQIVVADLAFSVAIDATPPDVTLTLSGPIKDQGDYVAVAPGLSVSVRDAHLESAAVEIGRGENPGTWEPFHMPLSPVGKDPNHLMGHRGLSVEQYVDHRFRLRVVDGAGNETIKMSPLGTQALIVHGFGPHDSGAFPDFSQPDSQAGGAAALEPVLFAGWPPRRMAAGTVRFGVTETVRSSLARVFVQFRDYVPVGETPAPWFEARAETFLQADGMTSATIPETWLDIVWDLSPLPGGIETELRLKAVDMEGTEYFSNSFTVLTESVRFNGPVTGDALGGPNGNLLLRLRAEALDSGQMLPGDFLLWGTEFVAEPLADVTLHVRSDEDPRYAVAVPVKPVAVAEGGFLFTAPGVLPCKRYEGFVVAQTEPEAGQPSRTITSDIKVFEPACMTIITELQPPSFGECGASATTSDRTIELTARSLDGVALTLLTLSRVDQDGGEEILFTVNKPVSDQVYPYLIRTTDWPEGIYTLVAEISNGEGEYARQGVPLVVDHTPPNLEITQPLEGARLCAKPQLTEAGLRNVFPIEGRIEDNSRFSYFLELAQSADAGAFGQVTGTAPCYGEFSMVMGTGTFCGPMTQGLLAVYGDDAEEPGISGDAVARLHAFDWGGHHVCKDVSFTVDGEVEGAMVTADTTLFSPNADGVLDEVGISYQVDEKAFLDIAVHRAVLSQNRPEIFGPELRVIEDAKPALGTGSATWDGTDDQGHIVADGLYAIVLGFRDVCGNIEVRERFVQVDTTKPDIVVSSPRTGDPLPLVVEVRGSVEDPNLAEYTIDFGTGKNPRNWVNIATGNRDVRDDVLAAWNTYGLQGEYILRLSAVDEAGNANEVRIPLSLDTPLKLITYFEATPNLFSPNGDSTKETATIRFGLNVAAKATLTVRDDQGALVRVLLDSASLGAGAASRNWDGRNENGDRIEDGLYGAVLRVEMTGNGAVIQEERIGVVLDATPPTVRITHPVGGGFATASDSVAGTIKDAHLGGYVVSVATSVDTPSWKVLDKGDTNRIDHAFHDLASMPEGAYLLRVEAWDDSGSRTEHVIPFVMDNTPPMADLSAPVNGATVGAAQGVVTILGNVHEIHPKEFQLDMGLGTTPSDWTTLISGYQSADGKITAQWDVSNLPDGPYTVRLVVSDRAGLAAESRVTVTVDSTLPAANLENLHDGDYLTGALAITGTASDANFARYRLSVAPGPKSSASRWSPIGSGSQPVVDGVLLDWQALPVDGTHTVRLEVWDRADNEMAVSREIHVDLNPPAPPGALTAVLENGIDARLTWQGSSAGDLAGYRIYRDGARIGPEQTSEEEFTDRGLTEGIYAYTVTAVDRAGLESAPSDATVVAVDLTGPAVRVLMPSEGDRVSGVVAVKGVAYSQADFKEYRLYAEPRSQVSAQTSELLRRSPIPVLNGSLAQWKTLGLPEESEWALRLEAEDLSANIATTRVEVVVDNVAPAAPTGLVATVSEGNVTLTWSPNNEPDLLGYLVFRDGLVANAVGLVVNDFTPYVVRSTSYLDEARPDGRFHYEIYAIDEAGNLSAPSMPAKVKIDRRAPRAVIANPDNGHRFDGPLHISATVIDEDVNQIQFQYRANGEGAWHPLGPADESEPWETHWDPAGMALGNYQLRAVATDVNQRTDESPPVITVAYADLTPPKHVAGVEARTTGGDVTLTWLAGSDDDLAGYHVSRAGAAGVETRITAAPVTDTTYLDTALTNGQYSYAVAAVDEAGNVSAGSSSRPVLVYTPSLRQPYTPTTGTEVDLRGEVAGNAQVIGLIDNGLGNIALPAATADAKGWFAVSGIPLDRGKNNLTIWGVDDQGSTSKPARVTIISGVAPKPPGGIAVVNSVGLDATVSWNANPEPDILGYRVFRDGEPLLADIPLSGLDASASTELHPSKGPSNVLDQRHELYWAPRTSAKESAIYQWLMVSWSEPRLVTRIDLTWGVDASTWPLGYAALDYDLEAWDGQAWVPVAEVRDNAHFENTLVLTSPYRTARLRVLLCRTRFPDTDSEPVRVSNLEITARPYVENTVFRDTPLDGSYEYRLTALNEYGFESAPSESVSVDVGDTTPPLPVRLSGALVGADVVLDWSASESADVVAYGIYRDGSELAHITDLSDLAFTDASLVNGTYRYKVFAVDAAGNLSDPSNEIEIRVATVLLPSPIDLAVVAVPEGAALDIAWKPESGSLKPQAYRLYRGNQSGGPYEPVITLAAKHYRDTRLINGIPYYYVVAALDTIGNEGPPSREAQGTPLDSVAPVAPVLHTPTFPGVTSVTDETSTVIAGSGEPGALVSLFHHDKKVAETYASATDETRSAAFFDESVLSPDGRYLWVRDPAGPILYDYKTRAQRVVPGISGVVRWFNDSRRLAVADGTDVGIYSLDDDRLDSIASAVDVLLAAPAPGGNRLMVLAERNGKSGWFVLDSGTLVWVLVFEDPDYRNIDPYSVSWSPDGSTLVYVRGTSSPAIEVLDLGVGETRVIDTWPGFGAPHWSPDGSAVAFTSLGGGTSRIWQYRLADHETQLVSQGTAEAPQWSPDGRGIAYITEAAQVVYQSLEDVETRHLYDAEPLTWYGRPRLQWSARGHLGILATYVQERLTLAGGFELEDIGLVAGSNVFTAVARDESGNSSSASEPITLRLAVDKRPDLSLNPQELVVLPDVARVGETVRVTTTVRNTGSRDSPDVDLSLVVLGPNHFRADLANAVPVATMAPGGSHTLRRDLTIPPGAGVYTAVAVVDGFDDVAEVSESNNRVERAFVVATDDKPVLSVDTDKIRYLSDQELTATIDVINPGSFFTGNVDLGIEDELGFAVTPLTGVNPVALDYGERLSESVTWNTGMTFAGDYRVHATLRDEKGLVVQNATAPFNIAERVQLSNQVTTNRVQYSPGDSVRITGRVDYQAGNTPLARATARFQVLNSAGGVVGEFQRTLVNLLPVDETTIEVVWKDPPLAPGEYRIVFFVDHGGAVLGLSETLFQFAENTAVELQGKLTLASNGVAVGDLLEVDFTVDNLGLVALENVAIALTLEGAVQGDVLQTQTTVVDLGPGEATTGRVELATQQLDPGQYLIVMTAGFPKGGETTVLDVAGFSVVDGRPPILTIDAPGPGAVVPGDPLVEVTAFDLHSGIRSVQVSADGGDWINLTPSGLENDIYRGELTGLLDGEHRLQAGATDAWGNRAETGILEFTLDAAPPVIKVLGVENGGEYPVAVKPIVQVFDDNPALKVLTLNGKPFVSGTLVEHEGDYTLQVTAVDGADNRAAASVGFRIAFERVPGLKALLTDELVQDRDGTGRLDPGDTLGYRVLVANTGNLSLTGLSLQNLVPRHGRFVPGSLRLNGAELKTDQLTAVEIGELEPGASVTASFDVDIEDPVPHGINEIINQGVVMSHELAPVLTDDPDLPGETDPTVTALANRPVPIPTLSVWAMGLQVLLLVAMAYAQRRGSKKRW